MAQFGRPITDTTRDNWFDPVGGTTGLFGQIDEPQADDADYIQTQQAPTNDVYVTRFSPIENPAVSTGHIIRYRFAKDTSGGNQIDLTVELRQGYVSEVSLGTLIRSWTHANITEALITAQQVLSTAEADAITDYGNLYLRVVANQP